MAGEERHHRLARMLELDLEVRGGMWDDAPCLSFIYEDEDGEFELSELSLTHGVWQPHPSAGLMRLAETMNRVMTNVSNASQMISDNRPESWRGVAFFSEAWMVIQDVGSEIDPVLKDMSRARMLSTHPGRVEVRGWWALMAADRWLMIVSQRRDTGEIMTDGCSIASDDNPKADGTIVDALTLLTSLIGDSR